MERPESKKERKGWERERETEGAASDAVMLFFILFFPYSILRLNALLRESLYVNCLLTVVCMFL